MQREAAQESAVLAAKQERLKNLELQLACYERMMQLKDFQTKYSLFGKANDFTDSAMGMTERILVELMHGQLPRDSTPHPPHTP